MYYEIGLFILFVYARYLLRKGMKTRLVDAAMPQDIGMFIESNFQSTARYELPLAGRKQVKPETSALTSAAARIPNPSHLPGGTIKLKGFMHFSIFPF